MSLNQVNLELNDAFETYFPRFGLLKGFAHNTISRLILVSLRLRTRLFGGRLLVNDELLSIHRFFDGLNRKGLYSI